MASSGGTTGSNTGDNESLVVEMEMQHPDLIKSFPELISIQQPWPCDMILATLILKADFPSHSNGSRKCSGWIQKTAKPMHRTSCAAIPSRGFFQHIIKTQF